MDATTSTSTLEKATPPNPTHLWSQPPRASLTGGCSIEVFFKALTLEEQGPFTQAAGMELRFWG